MLGSIAGNFNSIPRFIDGTVNGYDHPFSALFKIFLSAGGLLCKRLLS